MKRCIKGSLIAAMLALGFVGCGADSGGETDITQGDVVSLVCGPGTVEVDGQCLPETEADVVDGETEQPLECGPGTLLEDGKCVIDEEAAADLLKADVASVKVTALRVEEEGIRPIYPMHPVNATVTLEVETADALDTTVVLGFESKDGSKRCVAGYWPLVAGKVNAEEGVVPTQTLVLAKDFYIQPECDVLAGQTDVVAWVAFDPFDHLNVAGRDIVATDGETMVEFLQQARLSLDGCTAPDTAHPDNCVTSLELQASPGRDVVMTDASLSSTVAVLEMPEPVPELTDPTMTDSDGNVIDLTAVEPNQPHSTSPHFLVNADLLVYGLDGTEEDKVDDASLSLNFAIRPVAASLPDNTLPAEAMDWLTLYSEKQDEPKAGEEPTINMLEEEFLQSLAGPQDMSQTSPIFITADAETQMAYGLWKDFEQFEVRVCTVADFEEKGVAENALENNCRIIPVIVLRQRTSGGAVDEIPAAGDTDYNDGILLGDTYGNPEKVGVKFTMNADLISSPTAVAAGGTLGAYLLGWFDMTLFEAKRHGWDYYNAATTDSIVTKVTVFGFVLTNKTDPFPVGDTTNTLEYSKSSPDVTFGFDIGICTLGLAAHAEGAVGIDVIIARSVTAAQSTNPKCTQTGAVTVGNLCVKVFNSPKNQKDALKACRADAGWLVAPSSANIATAILSSRTTAGVAATTNVWVEGMTMIPDCYMMNEMRTKPCNMLPNVEPFIKLKADCLAKAAAEKQTCMATYVLLQNWNWSQGPFPGNLSTSGVGFATGSPDDLAPGEGWLAMDSAGKVVDLPPLATLPYACAYPLSYTAGGTASASVVPFARLTLVGEVQIDLKICGGSLWVSIILLEARLPITGIIQWLTGTPILTQASGDIKFVLEGLGGAIGATVWAKILGSKTWTFFSWASINYGQWTLATFPSRWRSQ